MNSLTYKPSNKPSLTPLPFTKSYNTYHNPLGIRQRSLESLTPIFSTEQISYVHKLLNLSQSMNIKGSTPTKHANSHWPCVHITLFMSGMNWDWLFIVVFIVETRLLFVGTRNNVLVLWIMKLYYCYFNWRSFT